MIESLVETITPRPAPKAVSIVVPAFNEAAHIVSELEALAATMRSTDWEWEILVVDDGSTDGTAEAAASAGVRVLRREQNRGYGASLKAGVRATIHPWILITDADGTYPTEAIPALLDATASADMVVGARTGSSVRIPLIRRPAKTFLRMLASYLANRSLPDINSGLRIMHRELIEKYFHLLPDGFSFTTTITLAAACNAHPVQYQPIDYRARLGSSKIRPRHAFDFTLLVFRVIVFFNPLRVFIPLGAILATAGAAKFIFDLTRDNLSESAVLGLLGAMIIWAVGLLADQNARAAMQR